MITEDFCSYDVAKLLKEKGFDEPCKVWYSEYTSQFGSEKYTSIEFDDHNRFKKGYKFLFYAPTHQMAMKWLRKEHNILLFLLPAQENGKLVYLVEVWTWNEEEGIYESTYAPMPRKEPEQAIGSALKYSLENLI